MYLLAPRRGDLKTFDTAREALCHLYDLRDAKGPSAHVTDCEGRPLTEAQLTTLSIAEGLVGPHDLAAS